MIFTNESQSISQWKCTFSALRHGTLGEQQKWSNGILLDPMTHQVMLLQKWLSDKWSTDEKAFRADWGHFLFLASSANITDALLVVGDLSNSCKEENPFTGQSPRGGGSELDKYIHRFCLNLQTLVYNAAMKWNCNTISSWKTFNSFIIEFWRYIHFY